MFPSDGPEHMVLQGLGIDGDAAHAVSFQHLQLRPVDGVRPAGLHGILGAALQRQDLPAPGEQTVQLDSGQSGGRTTPHVEGAKTLSSPLQDSAQGVDLLQKGVQIGLQQLQRPAHIGGHKGAVGAPGGTEGDAHIERDLVLLQSALGIQAGLGAVHRQLRPLRGDIAVPLQAGPCLLRGGSGSHLPGGQLHRAHAGEHPPGGRSTGDPMGGQEKAPADGPAAQALPLKFVPRQGGVQPVGCRRPPPGQLHLHGTAVRLLPEGDPGPGVILRANGLIDGPLTRKQVQHPLFHNIPLVVPL